MYLPFLTVVQRCRHVQQQLICTYVTCTKIGGCFEVNELRCFHVSSRLMHFLPQFELLLTFRYRHQASYKNNRGLRKTKNSWVLFNGIIEKVITLLYVFFFVWMYIPGVKLICVFHIKFTIRPFWSDLSTPLSRGSLENSLCCLTLSGFAHIERLFRKQTIGTRIYKTKLAKLCKNARDSQKQESPRLLLCRGFQQ